MRALRVLAWLAVAVALPVTAVQAAPPAAGTERLSATLAQLGEYGETIYDAVKADNWSTAQRQGALARQRAAVITRQWPSTAEISAVEAALAAAIKDRRRDAALREANRLTLVTAEMASRFDPPIPLAVNRLDYLGRELEIWAEPNDQPRLDATVADIRATWERLRPGVAAKREGQLIAHVDGLVSRLQRARSSSQYRTLAHELLDAVDRLETTLKKERR